MKSKRSGSLRVVTNRALQFKISLRGIDPPIWRRIRVPAHYTFWDLHVAIQDAMGWTDTHLHVFRIPPPLPGEPAEIGIPDEDFEDSSPCMPGWEVLVTAYLNEPGSRADYEYDFGDGWEHEVLLEEIVETLPGQAYPQCLDGARACPPEDCGGVGGYEDLLNTLRNPSHEEYESTLEWLGGDYDPDAFDPAGVQFDDPSLRWKLAFADEPNTH